MKEFVVLCCVLASASGAVISSCGGPAHVNINDVVVTGCEGATRCQFKRGTKVSIHLPFTLDSEIQSLRAEVFGILGVVRIPFPLPQSNACEKSGLQCPLQPNQLYTYTTSLDVKTFYPKIDLEVEWHLKNSKGNIICLKFPVALVD